MLDYKITPFTYPSQSKYMHIKILDSKELKFDPKNGIEFSELSALAFKDSKLYALSDKGFLYIFHISFNGSKLQSLTLEQSFKLKSKKKNILKKNIRDAEGLAFWNNKLLISFERRNRIDLYTLNGFKIKKIKINKALREKDNYKGKNKGLESVAYSEKYGIITAPEKPLKNSNKRFHILYAKNRSWKFIANGSITALEFMNKNKVLVLLREFNIFTRHRVTSLVSVNLKKCKKGICKSKLLAKLDSFKGWHIDNFEGLTKVDKNRYLMVSDDNGNFFQKTLLVFFEVID
jgi:hypothetical protein